VPDEVPEEKRLCRLENLHRSRKVGGRHCFRELTGPQAGLSFRDGVPRRRARRTSFLRRPDPGCRGSGSGESGEAGPGRRASRGIPVVRRRHGWSRRASDA
jgi:hypothetical protein